MLEIAFTAVSPRRTRKRNSKQSIILDREQYKTPKKGSGWWASTIGGAVILIGAIGLFCEIQDALNTVLEVPSRPISVT